MFVFAIEPAIKYKIPNNIKKLDGLIMFSKRPILVKYEVFNDEIKEQLLKENFMNMLYDPDGEIMSFRCPKKSCGMPVKIGIQKCPFCYTRFKWKYPFKERKANLIETPMLGNQDGN